MPVEEDGYAISTLFLLFFGCLSLITLHGINVEGEFELHNIHRKSPGVY